MATYNAPETEGGTINLGLTGACDSIEIKKSGLYKFVLFGAGAELGPYVGKTIMHVQLKKGDIIYACVGGFSYAYGGFNGGGDGGILYQEAYDAAPFYGGGGATHIAKSAGLLKNVPIGDVIAVAGGCGGGWQGGGYGGTGGGLKGGGLIEGSWDTGGTQTRGGIGVFNGSYGQGGSATRSNRMPGGGGGLYGGAAASLGGGGSGYIKEAETEFHGSVYANSTVGGIYRYKNSNEYMTGIDGAISVTFIEKSVSAYYGADQIDAILYGSEDIADIFYGEEQL